MSQRSGDIFLYLQQKAKDFFASICTKTTQQYLGVGGYSKSPSGDLGVDQ
jgi:hypothetical protein